MMFINIASDSEKRSPEEQNASAETFLGMGYAAWAKGDESAAETAFRNALSYDSNSAEAMAALAELSMSGGRFDDAANLYAQAATRAPDRWAWQVGWAEAESASGRRAEAIALWRRLLEQRPDSAQARRGLAQDLATAGHIIEAIAECQEAIQLDPGDERTILTLATLLIAQDEPTAALERLQSLLRRPPPDGFNPRREEESARQAEAHRLAGQAWAILGETAKARQAWRQGASFDPEGRFFTKAFVEGVDDDKASDSPQPPTSSYVRALFDRYADRFDQDLTERLGYCAPDLLRQAVEPLYPGRTDLRILDIGCGSGLAGAAFRSLAKRLAGVDLAPRMIEKARTRNVYDDLAIGDLLFGLKALSPSFSLEDACSGWDIVVAADVLMYLGDLTETFRAIAAALTLNGRLAATVERTDQANGFVLQPSRRYAHSPEHVREALIAAGLMLEQIHECSSRREKGHPVPGLLILACKTEACKGERTNET
ncbi:putative TPR repeat methyltransferase [Azospirillaceae bacterium]